MKIEYLFEAPYKLELENWLKKNNVKYKVDGGDFLPKCLYASIWSTRKDCALLLEELSQLSKRKPYPLPHYSDKDLSSAELLMIQAKTISMCIENNEEAFRYSCRWSYMADRFEIHKANHEEQIGTIMIKKEPPHPSRTVIWGPDDGGVILFADARVRELVQKEDLKGILFQDILLKNRTISKRVFQMEAEHKILHDDISWGWGEHESVCSMCGKKQYAFDSTYQLHLWDDDVYRELDFFSTERIWGEGMPQPIYIISQRFYQLLKQNKYTSRLGFTPVILV